jgi:hypothetical protein
MTLSKKTIKLELLDVNINYVARLGRRQEARPILVMWERTTTNRRQAALTVSTKSPATSVTQSQGRTKNAEVPSLWIQTESASSHGMSMAIRNWLSYPGTQHIASLAEPHMRCRPVEWNISSPKCQFQSWINISKLRSQLKYRDYIESQVTHAIDTKVHVTKKESVREVESMMLLTFWFRQICIRTAKYKLCSFVHCN